MNAYSSESEGIFLFCKWMNEFCGIFWAVRCNYLNLQVPSKTLRAEFLSVTPHAVMTEIRSGRWGLASATVYGKGSIGLSDMFALWVVRSFEEPHIWKGCQEQGPWSYVVKCFPKGVQVWFLSVSEPKEEVGEKRREWGWPHVGRKRTSPCTSQSSVGSHPQQTLGSPVIIWWFLNHESLRSAWLWLYGNGVSRLEVGWGGSGRIPVKRLGNSWRVSVLGSDCFQSFIFWRPRKLISRLLFTFCIYSLHRTYSMPDTRFILGI